MSHLTVIVKQFFRFYFKKNTLYPIMKKSTCWSQGHITVKPVSNGHSKIDKTKTLMTNGNLMKVESIAECNTFDLH